jgi:NTP pyrophosphatase (non-canonical NTP hydrolase)
MDCTRESVGQLEIDAVVEAASVIYANHDANRSLWDVWSHALHHAGGVAEEIRKLRLSKVDDAKLRQEIADLALWVFTILIKLKGPLGRPIHRECPQDLLIRISVGASSLLWNRYPGVCPWCYCAKHPDRSARIDEADFRRPCCCDELKISELKKNKEELRSRAKRTRKIAQDQTNRRPQSLNDWQDLISALYSERLSQTPLTEVALHLFEEMGEVSDGLIRMYTYLQGNPIEQEILARQMRLEDELADVLSWLFGIVERLNMRNRDQPQGNFSVNSEAISNERLYLSQILWDHYGSNEKHAFYCRHCESVICTCPVLLIQTKEQVENLVTKLSNSPK